MTPRIVTGIEVAPDEVRVVSLTRHGAAWQVSGSAVAPLPKDQHDGLSEALRTACRLAMARGALAVTLPRGDTVARLVRLPVASPEQLEQMLALEAGQHVPFDPDQLMFGFALAEAAEGDTEVTHLLVAARLEVGQRLRQAAAATGSRPVSLAAPAAALARLTPPGQPAIVLQVEGSWASLDVVEGGLLLSRTVTLEPTLAASPAAEALAARLAPEIERSLLACPGLSARPSVVLAGAGATAELAAELGRRLGAPVSCWESSEQPLLGPDQPLGPRFAVAAAAALAAATGPATLALRAPAPAGRQARRSRVGLVAGLAVAAAVVAVLLSRPAGDPEQAARAARLTSQVKHLDAQLADLQATRQELSARLDGDIFAAALRDITAHAPQGVWLTSLACDRAGKATVRGRALSSKEVGALVTALGGQPGFRDLSCTFVRQSKVGSTAVVEFGLAWEPEGE